MSTIIDGSASVTINSGAVLGITSGTAVASTSGTSIDFTSIPSWVKRVTVMFNGVSTNGTSNIQLQIGAGSVTTSGYAANAGYVTNTTVSQAFFTTGFLLINSVGATATYNGIATISLLGSNTWCESGTLGFQSGGNANFLSVGSLTLGGTLDRVRITTVNGTDTFDAGSINILYE
jgi:hypothetical protein